MQSSVRIPKELLIIDKEENGYPASDLGRTVIQGYGQGDPEYAVASSVVMRNVIMLINSSDWTVEIETHRHSRSSMPPPQQQAREEKTFLSAVNYQRSQPSVVASNR